jgi:2C-methyl-D-erythritol 2,4-cyclodiphosphate synthase
LTEPTALNGTFVKYGNCIAGIDVIDIHARGANGTEDTNLMIHAILHALLKATGTGADVGDTDGYASSTRITPLTSQKMTMSAGEKCRANNSSPQIGTTSEGKVTLSTSAGCGND